VDPIAAALGADLPTWTEDPHAPSSRLSGTAVTPEPTEPNEPGAPPDAADPTDTVRPADRD
jgi:hypothetical protein